MSDAKSQALYIKIANTTINMALVQYIRFDAYGGNFAAYVKFTHDDNEMMILKPDHMCEREFQNGVNAQLGCSNELHSDESEGEVSEVREDVSGWYEDRSR